jgi:hypothetical protein
VFIKGAPCAKGAAPAYWSAGALQKILLHELGHFLGLYHSTEANGQTDHLDDTDEDNLMHHAPLTLPSPGFSLQQIAVLRAHPYVEYP